MLCSGVCVTQVSDSKSFKEFLALVLAIGNYVNATAQKKKKSGGAFGFQLKSLSKLQDTKTISLPRITMLQWLCTHCIDKLKKPELVDYDQAWDMVRTLLLNARFVNMALLAPEITNIYLYDPVNFQH